jgi:hypothetical protein
MRTIVHISIARATVLALTLAACARTTTRAPADSAGHGASDHAAADHASMDHAAMHGAASGDSAGSEAARRARASTDTAFATMQSRGAQAMGVDQYTSAHRFESLPDGGRIELQAGNADSASTARIREHLRDIARAFGAGDFATPGFVHVGEVPGTREMRERRDAITYAFAPLPRGGEVRITARDSAALGAVHAFLAYQRREHMAPGGAARD